MSSWHSKPLPRLLEELDARPGGLSQHQAEERLRRTGPNELEPPPQAGLLGRLLEQMRDPMILVLLAAAALSLWASGGEDWLDAAIILVIVVVNACISISQEDSAEKALEALRKMSAPLAKVVRDGALQRLETDRLVPGDLIHLEAGDLVPADARILEAASLQADESAMTGESVPVSKGLLSALPEDTPLAERHNMVLASTVITRGRAVCVVTGTGMDTEVGRIAGLLLGEGEGQTPLQKKMAEISKTLSFVCLCVCAVMFGVGLLQGRPMLDMFLTAVSLAVAAIPEGLPAIVTIVLALGVGRMADRGAIVKKLPAVETLGCAGVICSDKTGTLTQNRMTVQEVWIPAGGRRRDALLAGALCNDARLEWRAGAPAAQGDPTEGALIVAAAREGLDRNKLDEQWPRQEELPFDSGRKLMSTIHPRPEGGFRVFVKGAPDVLLERCAAGPQGVLTPRQREGILRANEEMAGRALRVLGVAYKDLAMLPRELNSAALEQGLTFVGLIGMIDPPRPEVRTAVEQCYAAGIKPVMITGDHKLTAVAIARELNIYRPGDLALTGEDLDFLPQEVLEQEVEKFSVYARVSPEHKMRIVKAWQARGKVVAMTGDGVNDAPSIKSADIGIGMGITGTDVTKNVADMVLSDDNFATIVGAVAEGRRIYDNIRKAIGFLLASNMSEVLGVFFSALLGFTLLNPVHLLFINLITDCFPALALGMERPEPDIMRRPPRSAKDGIFSGGLGFDIAYQGILITVITMASYIIGHCMEAGCFEMPRGVSPHGMTMAFLTMSMCEIFHSFNMRSQRRSVFTLRGHNKVLWAAMLGSLLLTTVVLEVPPIANAFGFTPVSWTEYGIALALAVLVIPIVELVKLIQRRLGK